MNSLHLDESASNGSPGAARPDPTPDTRQPEVHYVAGHPEAVGRRPHLIILCNDDITNYAGVRDDHEQIGWLSHEAGQMAAVDIEAEAMRLYGHYEGVGGRPTHAEFPEPDPIGQMLGRIAVEVCKARTRHAADADVDSLGDREFRQHDLKAADIARRLRVSPADVDEAVRRLCPELFAPRKKRPPRGECPLCKSCDELEGLAYDEILAGRLALRIFREREKLFPPDSVGMLLNSARAIADELDDWPQAVREILSLLLGEPEGDDDGEGGAAK